MVENDDARPGDGLDVDVLLDESVDDEVYRALADGRRRIALAYLLEHSEATVEELADVVAGVAGARGSVVVGPADREAVRIELFHRHLPVLSEARLVEFDPTTGEASGRRVSEAVRSLLEWSAEPSRPGGDCDDSL